MSKRYQEMEKFVKEIMEFYGCKHLYIINGTKWYGNYGKVCSLENGKLVLGEYESLRTIYKAAHRIWNNTKVHQDDRIYKSTYFPADPALFLIENGHQTKGDQDGLFTLVNGQIYDAYDYYWYDIHASKVLKKWLKGGYKYFNSQIFYEDWNEEEERIWNKQHPDSEE